MAVKCQAPRVFSASEAIAALPEGLVLVTLNLKPVAGQSFLVISLNTLSYLVHRYFGGGNTKPPSVTGRVDATSSEMRVAGKLTELYLQSVIDAFKEKITFETEVIDTQNNLDALEERVATEKYLALVTDVSTPDFEDALRLFVPFESFEGFEDKLAGPKQESGVSLEGEWQVRMAEQMQDVAVEVSGVLASIELPLREVLGLKVGDVIDLAQLGSVSLEVQNQSVGFGQFGVFDDKKSVKYGMRGLLDLGAGVTLSSAIDEALNEGTGNE
jgi:flagellar motor switch protein FliM